MVGVIIFLASLAKPVKKETFVAKNSYVESEAKVSDPLDEDESVSGNSGMDISDNSSEDDKSDDNRSDVSGSKKPKANRKEKTPDLPCIPRKKPVVTKNGILS